MNYQISDSSNSSASGPSTGGALVPSSSSGIGSKRNKKSTVNNNPLISERKNVTFVEKRLQNMFIMEQPRALVAEHFLGDQFKIKVQNSTS